MFCKECNSHIPDVETVRHLITSEIKSDNDHARRAEYSDEEFCPECGEELVEDAECKLCEQWFVDSETYYVGKNLYCLECLPLALVAEADTEYRHGLTAKLNELVEVESADELIKEALEEYYSEGVL